MKITLENTNEIVMVENREGDCHCAVPGRIWEGLTETGIYVQCVITRIAVPNGEEQDQFDRELEECRPPEPIIDAFPIRMVL